MSYTDDTEFATRNLIELAIREEAELSQRVARLAAAERELKVHQLDFETSDLNDDFSDVYVMAAFGRVARAGQFVSALQSEVAQLQAAVGAKQHAVQAICGSVLQIAKQGISLVHGGLAAAPAGRLLGTASLKDIIWQARNQALHYEEGNFRPPVVQLFAALETSHGAAFSLAVNGRKSLAKQVIHLLGWTDYDSYLADAHTLGL